MHHLCIFSPRLEHTLECNRSQWVGDFTRKQTLEDYSWTPERHHWNYVYFPLGRNKAYKWMDNSWLPWMITQTSVTHIELMIEWHGTWPDDHSPQVNSKKKKVEQEHLSQQKKTRPARNDLKISTTEEESENWTHEDQDDHNTPRVNSKKKVEHCHLNEWHNERPLQQWTPRTDHLALIKTM